MKEILLYLTLAVFIVTGYSCKVSKTFTNMTYLNDSVTAEEKIIKDSFKIVLEPGDRISIVVSALNSGAAQQFNAGGTSLSNDVPDRSVTAAGKTANTGITYLVDNDGYIKFPQIGNVLAKGLTTKELGANLEAKLVKYLQQPVVYAVLANFRVNVLGEVNAPGVINVPDGKITILQAISQCGDLTVNALRENILVVREKDGLREFGKIDLSSNKIFTSPYFYLKQGDVVYVAMNRNKLVSSDAIASQRLRVIALIFASVSVTILLYNTIKNF